MLETSMKCISGLWLPSKMVSGGLILWERKVAVESSEERKGSDSGEDCLFGVPQYMSNI